MPLTNIRADSSFRNTTNQYTHARFVSRFGWGLTKRIEQFGAAKFHANVERVRNSALCKSVCFDTIQSRQGISLVLRTLRELREARMHLGPAAPSLSARLDFGNVSRTSFHSPALSELSDPLHIRTPE